MVQASAYRSLMLSLLMVALAQVSSAQQSRASFAAAIANQSTSPRYILVTIVNDNTGSRQTICTLATFFEGAIHYQYHLPYTDTGQRRGREIALASKDRTYHFSDLRALNNLRVRYTPQELAQIREQLRGYSTKEIAAEMSSRKGGLAGTYAKQKSFHDFAAFRDATAYVLLERGLSVGQADMTGGLYLVR